MNIKRAIIVGQSNVGKTLFMINFAEYLGLKKVYIKFEYPDGKILNKEMAIENARKQLSSSNPYTTRCLQKINIDIPVYKGKKELKVIDSSGFVDGIYPDIEIRQSIVQTLESLNNVDLIIHIVDLTTSCLNNNNYLSDIDKQIMEYGKTRQGYLFLANKIDVEGTEKGLKVLKEYIKDVNILSISALEKKGLNEVKSFVSKFL